jgi:hypothetical protein
MLRVSIYIREGQAKTWKLLPADVGELELIRQEVGGTGQ